MMIEAIRQGSVDRIMLDVSTSFELWIYIYMFSLNLNACASEIAISFTSLCLLHGWPVPHETDAVSVYSVYTIQPCIVSHHFMQSHICRVHVCLAVTCNLQFWQNDHDLLQAAGGGMDIKIRVSTESWPWRKILSCQDSNQRLHFSVTSLVL